jgi:Cys-tRNA(Pro)/Cys-tRNA(Cys) deacylase
MIKNNVIRLLESRNARFKALELPEEKLSALETASLLHVSVGNVFKSIVIQSEKKGKPILAIVPGSMEVDMKKLANLLEQKRLQIPSEREVEQLTGLQVGGISPIALLNKGFDIVLDQTALLVEEIHISGGQRGLTLLINVKDLIALIDPKIADITHPTGQKSTL